MIRHARRALVRALLPLLVPAAAHAQGVGVAPAPPAAPPDTATPPHLAPVAAPATPAAGTARPEAATQTDPAKPDATGAGIALSIGALLPAGEIASGVDMNDFYGVQPAATFLVQGYVHKNFGLAGGLRASYAGSGGKKCPTCTGYSFQVPVLAELAFMDRKVGPYVQLGMGFGTRFNVAGSGVTMTSRNDGVEFKFGIGYRFLPGASRRVGFTLFANLDRGEMTSLDVSLPGEGLSELTITRRSSHFTGELGLGVSFF
jgi:hypothetical protein